MSTVWLWAIINLVWSAILTLATAYLFFLSQQWQRESARHQRWQAEQARKQRIL